MVQIESGKSLRRKRAFFAEENESTRSTAGTDEDRAILSGKGHKEKWPRW